MAIRIRARSEAVRKSFNRYPPFGFQRASMVNANWDTGCVAAGGVSRARKFDVNIYGFHKNPCLVQVAS